jgi:hypothetical protein
LIESADHRAAQRGDLLFDLLDSERIGRPLKSRVHCDHQSWAGQYSAYQQSKKHEPEPELDEAFSHAETA